LAASSARFLGSAFVSSELRRLLETAAISSTAARNAASFALDGLLKPLTFRTNCSDAARISSFRYGRIEIEEDLDFCTFSLPRYVLASTDAPPIRGGAA
jgi:hypothetical protein